MDSGQETEVMTEDCVSCVNPESALKGVNELIVSPCIRGSLSYYGQEFLTKNSDNNYVSSYN